VNVTGQIYTAPLPVQEHTADDRYQLKKFQIKRSSELGISQMQRGLPDAASRLTGKNIGAAVLECTSLNS